jgi:hypothetical protein
MHLHESRQRDGAWRRCCGGPEPPARLRFVQRNRAGICPHGKDDQGQWTVVRTRLATQPRAASASCQNLRWLIRVSSWVSPEQNTDWARPGYHGPQQPRFSHTRTAGVRIDCADRFPRHEMFRLPCPGGAGELHVGRRGGVARTATAKDVRRIDHAKSPVNAKSVKSIDPLDPQMEHVLSVFDITVTAQRTHAECERPDSRCREHAKTGGSGV